MTKLVDITDKNLIIFLVISGLKIKDIKKDKDRHRSIVYFEDSEELKQARLNYTNKISDILILL